MGTDILLQFKIKTITEDSKHLEAVKQLGNENSQTLGFLPYGAFTRLAAKGVILGCLNPQGNCIGYLLYDICRPNVRLTHLCVNREWRGQGVAQMLVKALKDRTKHFYGVQVSCRRDYGLDSMWTHLGFVAKGERPGRGKDKAILTEWWLDYGQPNLLTVLAQKQSESKICAVIDANIFYDLADEETADEASRESEALMTDWVASQIQLYLTDEIHNEINRNQGDKKRKKLLQLTGGFPFLPCTQEALEKTSREIREFFPDEMSTSDHSDHRQLARVIGSTIQVPFFVTRDRRLLGLEDDIYQRFKLSIIHPVDLVTQLDEVRRESEYQPIGLRGTKVERQRVQSGNQESLIDLFLASNQGETKSQFRQKLLQLLSDPIRFECFIICRNKEPIALIAYDRTVKHELKIPLFRFQEGRLRATIIRQCIFQCFSTSASEGKSFTRITEVRLKSDITDALQEDKFLAVTDPTGGWLRINLTVSQKASEISSNISNLCNQTDAGYKEYLQLVDLLKNPNTLSNVQQMADLERFLYPAKITDGEIPTFIIPIQAWWAKDLFDEELAQETLWGAKEELALRREMIYYRSSRATGGLKAPGRILWYVSKKGAKQSTAIVGAIRACSRLDEIIVGKPKDLYRRFRRLGVYEFPQLLQTARDDLSRDIMAVRFSDTELFKNPIKLENLEQLIGKKVTVQAPFKITKEMFEVLYTGKVAKL